MVITHLLPGKESSETIYGEVEKLRSGGHNKALIVTSSQRV